jgi:hypothetical protein
VTTRLDLTVEGDLDFLALVEGVRHRTLDARPAFERMANDFYGIEREQFASQGARSGAAWPADTNRWTARKVKMGRSARTLVFTGTLEASLTRRGARWAKRQVSFDELVIGTSDPVAHLHAGRRTLVDMQQADRARWRDFMRDHLFATERHSMMRSLGL